MVSCPKSTPSRKVPELIVSPLLAAERCGLPLPGQGASPRTVPDTQRKGQSAELAAVGDPGDCFDESIKFLLGDLTFFKGFEVELNPFSNLFAGHVLSSLVDDSM